ncbi:MAG: 5'/3'-nucleotidase SurE [Pseudomonadota bacterium]
MRILVTNDDGISAEGLKVAEEIAVEIAGADGEVWVVAPAFEQSGVSHAVSFHSPIKVERLGARRYACAGAPADCVIVALGAFMKDAPPDLVLSGVNRGHNLAEDAVYSGTVGGAIEGALKGVKAIALSQYFRWSRVREIHERDGEAAAAAALFATARAHGASAVRRLLALEWTPDLFFNVNFPGCAPEEVKGARYARQGRRTRGEFGADERASPAGRPYFWLRHAVDNASGAPGDDCVLAHDDWITTVPMRPDYTDAELLARLQAQENGADG